MCFGLWIGFSSRVEGCTPSILKLFFNLFISPFGLFAQPMAERNRIETVDVKNRNCCFGSNNQYICFLRKQIRVFESMQICIINTLSDIKCEIL